MNSLKLGILITLFGVSVQSIGQVKMVTFDEITVTSKSEDVKLLYEYSRYIAFDETFDFREELRLAKSNNTIYRFGDQKVSKVQLLKIFRKASRQSKSVQEFNDFFIDNELDYISSIDNETLAGVYRTIRPKTINGYFDTLKDMEHWF